MGIDFTQNLPEDGFYLWHLLASMDEPIAICTKLKKYHATQRLVHHALQIATRAISACEELLVTSEPNGRPDTDEGWQVLHHTKHNMLCSPTALLPMRLTIVRHFAITSGMVEESLDAERFRQAREEIKVRSRRRAVPCLSQCVRGHACALVRLCASVLALARISDPSGRRVHRLASEQLQLALACIAVTIPGGAFQIFERPVRTRHYKSMQSGRSRRTTAELSVAMHSAR